VLALLPLFFEASDGLGGGVATSLGYQVAVWINLYCHAGPPLVSRERLAETPLGVYAGVRGALNGPNWMPERR
jgi:hypothetical protein